MLVGAGEIDAAMLVVAADDGPRPQTLEHLELLDALGIGDGIAAITKVDLPASTRPGGERARRAAGAAGPDHPGRDPDGRRSRRSAARASIAFARSCSRFATACVGSRRFAAARRDSRSIGPSGCAAEASS